MIFQNKAHENNFCSYMDKIGNNAKYPEYQALLYLLSLDNMNKHLTDLFDFYDCSIIPEGINKPWQTNSSVRTTAVAFTLFSGNSWRNQNQCYISTCSGLLDVFGFSEYDKFYLQAIRIANPKTTAVRQQQRQDYDYM